MERTAASVLFKNVWGQAPQDVFVGDVVTDSRKVTPGCVFVAIKGERVDGHNFANAALKSGAAVVMLQHSVEGVPSEKTVLVDNPLDALITMGGNYRMQFAPLVLAVTGSVGKTTTKEFSASIFEAFGPTLKTRGNENNEIGLPGTLFRMDSNTRYAVVEMGMQALGEIEKLSTAAVLDAAIITNIGISHIEFLGTRENILKAKMEVCSGMRPSSPLVLNADDALLNTAQVPANVQAVYAGIDNEDSDVRARKIEIFKGGQKFEIVDKQFGVLKAYVPALGKHNVQNALLAFAAATRLGLEAKHVAAALANYKTTGLRQNILEWNGVTLIEDCYNASPDSMRAALATMAQIPTKGRRIAVLGDMFELGNAAAEAHTQVGDMCAKYNVDTLITVGELGSLIARQAQKRGVSTQVCADNACAAEALQALAKTGDIVLVKASNGMKFDEILRLYKGL